MEHKLSKEIKVLLYSMIINFGVSTMKVLGGALCNSKSMISDGFHSLSDFITDIVAILGSKISHKRANKRYPFGFGRMEYLTDIFIGVTIFLLGVYSIFNSFTKVNYSTNIICLIIIIISMLLKTINSKILMKQGIESNSPILISSSKESFDDVASSIGVLVVIILEQFSSIIPILKYADIVGGVIIGLLIIRTSIHLLKDNVISLIGQTEENERINEKIKEIVSEFKSIKFSNLKLIKNGTYYQAELEINCDDNMRIKQLLKIEKNLISKIKSHNLDIKYVDVDVVPREN